MTAARPGTDRQHPSVSERPRRRSPTGARLTPLFWNYGERRARVAWLIALPVAGAYGALLMIEAATVAARVPLPVAFALWSVAAAVTVVVLVAASRCLGGRRVRDYGLDWDRRWRADLAAGLGIRLAAVALPMTAAVVLGWVTLDAALHRGELPLLPGFAVVAAGLVAVGFWEELAMRGVFLRNTADGLRGLMNPRAASLAALGLSGFAFGLAHLGQPEHPAFILTWVLAGLVLGGVYLASGSLALPIGIHIAINAGYQTLFVRTDDPAGHAFSAVLRIDVDPGRTVLQPGGLLDLAVWLTLAVLASCWLRLGRRSRPRKLAP